MELFLSLLLHVAKRLVNVTDAEKGGCGQSSRPRNGPASGWSPFAVFLKVCSPVSKSQAAIRGICGEDWLKRCFNGSLAAEQLPSMARPCKLDKAKLILGQGTRKAWVKIAIAKTHVCRFIRGHTSTTSSSSA